MATKRTKKKTSKATAKKATKKTVTKPKATEGDPQRPAVGTVLKRTFKGKEIMVEVVEGGFKFEDQTFKSISAVARHITGYMISGPVFFKLDKPEAK